MAPAVEFYSQEADDRLCLQKKQGPTLPLLWLKSGKPIDRAGWKALVRL